MRKKLLSLLLVLCMVLALAPAALADNDVLGAAPGEDGDVRETDFLDEQPHADVDYEDMEIVPLTVEDFTTAIDAAKALLTAGAPYADVLEAFHKVSDLLNTLSANLYILNIRKDMDLTDEESKDLYAQYHEVELDVFDPFIFLIQDVLKSEHREAFIASEKLTESDVEYYETYGGMSQEEKDLSMKISDLTDDYNDAYDAGDLEAMTACYMDILAANKESMKYVEGYDNYAEYAYAEIFGRDYTVEEARAFFDAVKEYIAPLSEKFDTIYNYNESTTDEIGWSILNGDYTTDETLALIRPYLGKLSGELLDAYDYMIGHHLYDITARENKYDGGYTTQIPFYNAPFFFNTPYGTVRDFSTIIHEFGHYNNYFSHPNTWNDGSCSIDVAEVHSQGLELLFTQFYDDIFGEYGGMVEDAIMNDMLGDGLLMGCLIGELELYAYTTEDVTADMIDAAFAEIATDYGFNVSSPEVWVTIPHMSLQPLYYISYATSAIGALTFWNEAQEVGYDKAADLYLEFVSQPYYAEFQEEFEEILGVNPMDPAYVAEIADTLNEKLDIDGQIESTTLFPDVKLTNPSINSYLQCYSYDLIHGSDDGLFHPEETATRAETVQAFYNLLSQLSLVVDDGEESPFTDVSGKWYEEAANFCAAVGVVNGRVNDKGECVFDGDAPITREELAVIAYRALTLFFDVPTDPNPALSDAPVSPWAADAMNAFANQGWLDPTADPHRVETRNAMVVLLNNILVAFI